jgi:hypothetical protein
LSLRPEPSLQVPSPGKRGYRKSGFHPQSVRLRDDVPVLLLVLWKILMPLASWLSRAYVSMWLRSRVTSIAWVRRARLIGLARLATVGIFRIASLRPNGHCEILQFFPNQTQFVDDLFSYLVFHMAPFTFYIARGDNSFSGALCVSPGKRGNRPCGFLWRGK